MRRFAQGMLAIVMGIAMPGWSALAHAQDPSAPGMSERGPRFLWRASPVPIPLDTRRTPALRNRIALDLRDVTVGEALEAIARASHIRLTYSHDVVPVGRTVRLVAQDITVAGALSDVLFDTGVDVIFERDGQATLVRKFAVHTSGQIYGRVTDARSGNPLASTTVSLEGSARRTLTGQDGKYRLSGVPAGEYTITARRIGYVLGTQKVMVKDADSTRADFGLSVSPTVLTEVVTTATGERSRLEVGNAIGTIKADSLVPTTLIRNVSDLLTARTPGVVVSGTTGAVGAPSKIRIRGVSSLQLNNDPIVIVDGMRLLSQTSVASSQTNVGRGVVALAQANLLFTQDAPSRLDDIDPNTIESIDVLRGPSAATLYGTEAAKGVIVIKTKQGRAGPYRFTVMADQGWIDLPARLPLLWIGYGHALTGTTINGRRDVGATFGNCQLVTAGSSAIPSVADGTCVQDSVVGFNPQNDPQMRTLAPGTARNLSGTMSGGTDQLKEFLSVRLSDNVGLGKISAIERRRILQTWNETPPSWVERPNTEQDINGSSRTNLRVASNLDFSLSGGMGYRNVLSGDPGTNNSRTVNVSSLRDSLQYLPGEVANARISSLAKRAFFSGTGNYRPASWLSLHGTLGGDYTLRTDDQLLRPTECTVALAAVSGCSSDLQNARGETFVTTMDMGALFTFAPSRWLTSRTAIGEQVSHTTFSSLSAGNGGGTNLAFGTSLLTPPPVNITTSTTLQLYGVSEARDEAGTAGWYVEQTAAIRERLFLTAALREDAASAFGPSVNARLPVYPKFSLSWLVSDEAFFPWRNVMPSFRVRAAYGHSGNQAQQGDILPNYRVVTAVGQDGTVLQGLELSQVSNPNLKPERTTECEGGFDVSFFENERIHVEATVYRKLSHDAIIGLALPPSYGTNQGGGASLTQKENVGSVENRGTELSVNAKVLDSRAMAWDLTMNVSQNANKLVHLSQTVTSLTGSSGTLNKTGYPIFGFWGARVRSYADLNGDGLLAYKEVALTDTSTFFGAPYPRTELTYLSHLTVFNGALRVTMNLQQTLGLSSRLVVANNSSFAARNFIDPTMTLAQQAAGLQALQNGAYIDQISSLRFSELSVTYTIPRVTAQRFLHSSSASVTFAGRNLALWTMYAGNDPNVDTQLTTTGTTDAPNDAGFGIPPSRNWLVRINLGY